LYELLIGQSPFKRKTPLASSLAHLQGAAPDPRRANPAISEGVGKIIRKCLQKEPARRYQSAGELYQALAACAELKG
jgi:eukaryotic-like serine/threonine-protein kinase